MCFRPAEVAAKKNLCKKCGIENEPAARKCVECGAELKAPPPLPGMAGGTASGPGAGAGAPKAPGGFPAAPKMPTMPEVKKE